MNKRALLVGIVCFLLGSAAMVYADLRTRQAPVAEADAIIATQEFGSPSVSWHKYLLCDAADGVPCQRVDEAGNAAVEIVDPLPAGTNPIGKVDIGTFTPGDVNFGNVDVASVPVATAAGSLSALNSEVILVTTGSAAAAFEISGIWTATVTFEGQVNTIWNVIDAWQASGSTSQTTTATNGTFVLPVGGFKNVRARVSAYTSGTLVVSAQSALSTAKMLATISVTGAGTSSGYNAAFPAVGTAIGFSDGTNMQPGAAVDLDTGAGTRHGQIVNLVKRASGGPVEIGTSADPIRNDPTGTTTQPTGGLAAEGAAVTGSPHQTAGRTSQDEPTTTGDGLVKRPWYDPFGRTVVQVGHADPEAPVSIETTATGNSTVIVAPGGTNKLCINRVDLSNSHTADINVRLEDGVAGTVLWRGKIVAGGGGFKIDFGSRGACLTDNTLLNVNLDVDPAACPNCFNVNVTEYYIADLP